MGRKMHYTIPEASGCRMIDFVTREAWLSSKFDSSLLYTATALSILSKDSTQVRGDALISASNDMASFEFILQ